MMKRNYLTLMAVATLLIFVTMSCKEKVTGVSLSKTGISLNVGEKETLTAIVEPVEASNQTVKWTSSNTTVATVSDGAVTAKAIGVATITVNTADGNYAAACTVRVGIVINGVTWAPCNVDAPGTFAAHPEEKGMFYQWNRKKGWASTGSVTDWDSSIPEGAEWEKANDPCPPGWHIPTISELQSLSNANSYWIESYNEKDGREFDNGDNPLFLPAAGCRIRTSVFLAGTNGYYWSSSVAGDGSYYMNISSSSAEPTAGNNAARATACSVRCVAE